MRHAKSAASRTSSGRIAPLAASAPATTRTGAAGTGRPLCSSITAAKTSGTSHRISSATKSIQTTWNTRTVWSSSCAGKHGCYRNIRPGPRREPGRRPARDLVRKRNPVGPVRTQVGVGLEVSERRRDLGGHGERSGEDFPRHLPERESVTLPIQRIDDVVEAQEVANEGQGFAMARQIRVRERSGNDVADLADVAHVNAAYGGIDGQP